MATSARVCVSSSAERRVAWCAAELAALSPTRALTLLVPSLSAGERVIMQALTSGEARFAWQRRTLSELALALALPELSCAGLTLLRGQAAVLLVQRALERVAAQGALGRFQHIARTPGFAQALHGTLRDLRFAAVDPGLLAVRDATLAALLTAYEHELSLRALCDHASVLRVATARVERGACPRFLEQLAMLDVPLTHAAEAAFFRALADGAEHVSACVVRGDERTEAYVLGALPGAEVERREARPSTQLAQLKMRLFQSEGAAVAGLVENVRFIASPGEAREAVEVVRALLERAAEGVPFDRMTIVLRAADAYRSVVEEALSRADVPAYFAAGVERPSAPGRALLTLLACARDGVSLDGFCAYLSLAVAPPLPGVAGSVRRMERVLRAACAGSEPSGWCARLAGYAERVRREAAVFDESTAMPARMRDDAALAEALAAMLPALLTPLTALAGVLGFDAALGHVTALVHAALRESDALDDVLGELAPLASDAEVDAARLLGWLSARLAHERVPARGRALGKVFVGSPDDLRGLSFDSCFVLGLSEQLFPQRPREDALLGDDERAALSPDLAVTEERVHNERVLLRLAVGAAENALTLTFPRFDPMRGRPRVPSFYGLEILHGIDGVLPAFDALARRASPGAAARIGFPAPDAPAQAIDDAEYDLSVLSALRSGSDQARTGAARYLLLAHGHLARALRFRARRWTSARFTSADGFVANDESLRAFVAARALAVHPYAPTTLEALAVCPYRFYLAAFVGLREPEAVRDPSGLGPRVRGAVVHTAQARLLRRLCAEGPADTAYARAPAALAWLPAVLDEVLSDTLPERAVREDPLVRSEMDELARDLSVWLCQLGADQRYAPLAMELGFGLRPHAERDPRSVEDPVQLDTLRLRGAMDLVETVRGARGPDEPPVLRVTDTKTGHYREKLGTVSGGHALQPVLYALALERLFPGATVEGARLSYCTSRGEFRVHDVPLDARSRAIATDFVRTAQQLLAGHALYAAPEPGACASCAYRSVCGPYEEERVARVKVRDQARLAPLFHLRSLP